MSNEQKIDKYKDPENVDTVLSKIKNLKTLGEIKTFVDQLFPTWFVTAMDYYCYDYPHLNRNWYAVCDLIVVKPTEIMIVDDIKFDKNHKCIKLFTECFTRSGFSVRRKQEYIPCENCGCAVPTKFMWELFKQQNIKVPVEWQPTCTKC